MHADRLYRLREGYDAVASALAGTFSRDPNDYRLGAIVERVNSHVELSVDDVQHLNALVDRLRASGGMLTELAPIRTSLEDVFVDLIKTSEPPQ